MKLDSKYFDCIRVKPDRDRLLHDVLPPCAWAGCGGRGRYPAPRGRGREGQYFQFCLDHVRQYNKAYNYFAGMSDEDVARYQKDMVTGHRPTWSIGVNGWPREETGAGSNRPKGYAHSFSLDDPFGLFGRPTLDGAREAPSRRPIRTVERKCLRALGLDEDATADEIKASYKALVKLHHPDRNGGDRRSEDKLRDVIQAYTYLRQVGLC